MKKKYFTKEEQLEARKQRYRQNNPDPKYKEKYIHRNMDTGCWEWLGQKWSGGYGYVRINRKHIPAHRYIYSLYKGVISDGLDACHSCDNPGCVNPDHIWPGTPSDNLKDCYSKGRRTQRGTSNGNYKHGRRIRSDETLL